MYYITLGTIIAGIICAFVALVMVSQQRASENQKVLQLVTVCIFLAFVGYIMEITAKSVDGLLAGVKVGYMGKCFVSFLFLVFISQYGKVKINKSILGIALFINVIALILVMTSEYHTLYYSNISAKQINGFLFISFDKEICYYLYMAYCVFLFLAIVAVSYRNWRSSTGERKTCNAWLLAASLSPGIMFIIYLLKVVQFFDLTPFGLLIGCIIIIFTVKRYGVLNVIQIAQDNILKNTNDGMVIVDDEYNLVYANPAAYIAFSELKLGNGKQIKEKLNEIFQKEESVSKIGDKHYEIRISRLYEDKALRGYLAWIFDMEFIDNYANEILKLKEEAERANRAKTIFLANMSHEIRTPMNAVMGLSELIMQRDTDDVVKKYARDIKRSSQGLLNIINGILDITKIEAGKMQIVPEPYYAQSLFNDTMVIIAQISTEKKLRFEMHIDENIPYQMYGDAMRLREIFLNLLNNAVKYTNEGTIRFSAKVLRESNDIVQLEFRVKDTGVGIREEDMDKLFNQFEQLDIEKNKGIEGTGLGLTIVKELLNLMHGTIEVNSQYGKGSEFVITIPQKKIGESKIQKLQWDMDELLEESERMEFYAEQAKVLVVDDNQLNLEITKGLLENYNVAADLAAGGKEGITLAEKNAYDIIFMDCMMPVMDGTTAMKQIRELLPPSDCPPIIALTANAIVGVKEELKSQGFDDYMSKPINMSVLEKILISNLPEKKIVYGSKKPLQHKTEVKEKIEKLPKQPESGDEMGQIIRQIEEAMEAYDFEQACEILESLGKQYPETFSEPEIRELCGMAESYQAEEVMEALKKKHTKI